MKKGKKDRLIAQKVRVKSRDKEIEMKEHLNALTNKKSDAVSYKKKTTPPEGFD